MGKEIDEMRQSRKWQLTINNPDKNGFGHDVIKKCLKEMALIYWCMSDEIGSKEGTLHTHIYIVARSPVRFQRLKNLFPPAHIEYVHGNNKENRDYIKKEGKHKEEEGKKTSVPDTFEEEGELPPDRKGERQDIVDLYDMIAAGYTDAEILKQSPTYLLQVEKIGRARLAILEERYADEYRDLQVTYIWGGTGVGKTRSVLEAYGYRNVYRITDYSHPFDMYNGQDVVLFDEFRSSLKITAMLEYLQGYPLALPARFFQRYACYTKVYILSNISLQKQYMQVQEDEPETYKAFCRRINNYYHMNQAGEFEDGSQFLMVDDSVDVPFNDYEQLEFPVDSYK